MSDSETPQATTSTPKTMKRAAEDYVDPDTGIEVHSSKKSRIAPDAAKKVACLTFLLRTYEALHDDKFKTEDADYANITLANQITNIMFTGFTILRQRANGHKGNAELKAVAKKTFAITSLGKAYSLKVDDVIKTIEVEAKKVGLLFKKYLREDEDNWYGTALPYLDFFLGNGLRLTELRLGHDKVPVAKVQGKTKYFEVSKYGLLGQHHILLEGCTFPPEKRGSMAQSLGPMTTLLCHIRSEERYRKKWSEAAKRAMAHIPIIDEVLEVIRGKPYNEIKGVVKTLADLVLITTSRQAQRMFFPINMVFRAVCCPDGKKADGAAEDGTLFKSFIHGDELLKAFNVSGNGGFYLYNVCTNMRFSLEGQFTEEEAKQVVFHSIFGTFKEDLSILSQITNQGSWLNRESMGKSFRSQTSGKHVSFRPIKMNYYAKLASANQTGLLSGSYTQLCSAPVFGGTRTQHFSQEFFESLGKAVGMVSSAKSIPQVTAALNTILMALVDDLRAKGGKMDMGTVSWRQVDGMNAVTGGEEVTTRFVASGVFFLGKKK